MVPISQLRIDTDNLPTRYMVGQLKDHIRRLEHTPNPEVESCELRKTIRPVRCGSEKRSDQKTKYNDKEDTKMA